MGGSIVDRREKRLHPGQVRLDGFPESEPVRRLQKNLRDKNVAAALLVDPFHRSVGIGRGADRRPSKRLERLS